MRGLSCHSAHHIITRLPLPLSGPSRSETVTGRYLHNVKRPVTGPACGHDYGGHDEWGNVCCMHVDEGMVNNRTLAQYLQRQAGYRVGMFGKYLNNCPTQMPPGWNAWYANGGSTCECSVQWPPPILNGQKGVGGVVPN